MAIRMTCSGCDSALNLADNLRGKKVRCKKCGESLKVPADDDIDDVDDVEDVDDDANAVQEKPKLKVKPAKSAKLDDDDEDSDDDEPKKKKKKKKKKQSGSGGILIIAGVAGLVLLLAGGGVSAFLLLGRKGPAQNQQAKVDTKTDEADKTPVRIFPKVEDGSPTKKGGKGVVNNVRGAVYRTTIRNDLANYNKMYSFFVNETPKNQQTRAKYLEYIKRDFKTGHDYLVEGYYRINLKAQPGSTDIFAGERDEDNQGHLVVRCNGAIEYVPAAEWKKAMGL